MIRRRLVIALGLTTLIAGAAGTVLAQGQGRAAERRAAPGPYIMQTEQEARQHLEAEERERARERDADLSDRVTRMEGRLEGMEGANERATREVESVLATVRWCTIIVSSLIVLMVGVLAVLGYRELSDIRRQVRRAAVMGKGDAKYTAADHVGWGIGVVGPGNYERALVEFDHAILLDPRCGAAHFQRGTVLEVPGKKSEANAAFRLFEEVERGNARAFCARACAHARLGHRHESLRDLKKAVELYPDYRKEARADDDFASLHSDPEFRELVGLDDESGEEEGRESD